LEIPSTIKQIQYHTTPPLYKTIERPNDNAVGNHWRKSVLGNSCHCKPQLGFRVGKRALQGSRRNPCSLLQGLNAPTSCESISWGTGRADDTRASYLLQ